ncbi:hypothetical protein AALC17_12715 [Oscillospiraceae bacterium 38-13]
MMLQLEPRLIEDLIGRDLIAFGTGGLGKIVLPYLAQEPDIKLHGVTNSRVTAVDAGTFLDTGLPIRSLETWAKLMPEATILLCVVRKNEEAAWEACEAAGFRKIMIVPFYLVEMLQDIYNPIRRPGSNPFLHVTCVANELREVHKATFSEFKGCHRGETVAVVMSGPSLNYYKQIEGIPHIGANATFLKKDLHLDYYFLFHYQPEWTEKLKDYQFVKFFGRNEWAHRNYIHDRFPEYVVEENHARRYFSGEPLDEIYTDITSYPLMGVHTIAFHAIQFAIFTRPKRLLLIGCDCSYDGHFDGTPHPPTAGNPLPVEWLVPEWIKGYKRIKVFAQQYYPDVDIISVNPGGLKGLYHDMYTESYLDAHPELDRRTVKLLT